METDDPGGGTNVSNQTRCVNCDLSTKDLVNDGLICSIIKATSTFASDNELVTAVGYVTSEAEVKIAWTKLFSYFNDVYDDSRKVKIIDIKRQSKKLMIEDMVKQLKRKDLGQALDNFVLPWFYVIKDFKSDEQRLSETFVNETAKDTETRLNELEKKFEVSHNNLVLEFREWSQRLVHLLPPPYAAAVQSNSLNPSNVNQTILHSSRPDYKTSFPSLSQPGQRQSLRSRSGSNSKRPRTEPYADVQSSNQPSRKKEPYRSKAIVGTVNCVTSGRKMRSPPADIFVWGVHPETTIEDIKNDLADSGIVVQTTDIVKKSKEGSFLNSYRISVPAADLQKALSPEIWPLRVKVREYIYYPRKKQNQSSLQNENKSSSTPSVPDTTPPPTVEITPPTQEQTVVGLSVSNRFGSLSNEGDEFSLQ